MSILIKQIVSDLEYLIAARLTKSQFKALRKDSLAQKGKSIKTAIKCAWLKQLVDLRNLRSMHLQNKHVTVEELKELAGLRNLESLNLSGTDVTDVGLKELARLNRLQALDLNYT